MIVIYDAGKKRGIFILYLVEWLGAISPAVLLIHFITEAEKRGEMLG